MDPTTLVHQVINTLIPVIPYLSSAGTAIATKIGEDTYQQGKKLYHTIYARFAQEPDDKANKALQAWVDDPDLSSAVEVKLLRLIQHNSAFAGMLLHIIQTGPQMVIDASDQATVVKTSCKTRVMTAHSR